nr:uncharacterized protein LOC114924120 isoform X1 [Arachis hypogaea]XP_029152663.1 uncharacterized protein LOC114924120 isoform X1 [Arachis hypogaea]
MSDPHDEFKGKNVLIERKKSKDPSEITSKYSMSIETYKDILGECRRKLFEVRSRRARPHLDDKVSPLLYLGMDWLSHLFPGPTRFSWVKLRVLNSIFLLLALKYDI